MKMGGKIILARIPLPHGFWNKLGVFKHGQMQEFAYANSVFSDHLHFAGLEESEANAQKILLELGPGESLFTAVLAKANGFRGSILVDVGKFALPQVSAYRAFVHWLQLRGASLPALDDCKDLADVLARLNADYRTDGLAALKSIPDRSVDFVFSQAVLEHVREREFAGTVREIHRILKEGGVSTHVIDLKDHLQASLNNLRFSDAFWESEFVSSSGFYTNRLRYNQLMDIFLTAGFQVEVISRTEWETLPIPRRLIHPQFEGIPDDSLRVSGLTVRLRK